MKRGREDKEGQAEGNPEVAVEVVGLVMENLAR